MGNIMMVLLVAVFVMMIGGMIAAGLVLMSHFLKKKEMESAMESASKTMIPQMEEMTMRMLKRSMEMIPDQMCDMAKKLVKMQKEMEDDEYKY